MYSPNTKLWLRSIHHKHKPMFAATVLVPVEGEPPPSAKQAMADARVAWRTATVEVRVAEQKHFFKIATFKMVEALAHCKASLQCFQNVFCWMAIVP